mmetsp:Transcript_22738/g.35610  ORF Transcript_22738/g.35610 Transcript_22738/m.35610 type:complete len:89 (+) Transcript_22738:406-672(+)
MIRHSKVIISELIDQNMLEQPDKPDSLQHRILPHLTMDSCLTEKCQTNPNSMHCGVLTHPTATNGEQTVLSRCDTLMAPSLHLTAQFV